MAMTVPDPRPRRKPSRAGLYGPFVLLLIAIIGWSLYWVWIKGKIERGLDSAQVGGRVSWATREVSGYPFRLDVDFTDLRLADPSGWSLSLPVLKTEAYAYAPDHWMLVAPSGATFVRPVGGPVAGSAKVLRASVSGLTQIPARLSVEGENLTFTPGPGARPFFAQSAAQLNIHAKPGPADQGALYFGLVGVKASPASLIGKVAGAGPVSLTLDGIFSHASALRGANLGEALRGWARVGGSLQVRQATLEAGGAALDARSGGLTVGEDGRLQGTLNANLKQAPQALLKLAEDGAVTPVAAATAIIVLKASETGGVTHLNVDFQAGQTTLGPVNVAPAPKLF